MEPEKTPFQQKVSSQLLLSPLTLNIHLLMEALADDTLNFSQLADIVNRYPVIVARILSLANSAWVAPVVPITTIETACAQLGVSVVKTVSIAIAVASTFNASNCPDFKSEIFWTTSMLVSEGAFLLASRLPPQRLGKVDLPKTAQTAGILHGLGLLWLAENLPKETSQAFHTVIASPSVSLNDALIEATGTDYCQAGAWVGQQLKLPDLLIAVMQYHRDATYRDNAWELALIIGAALKMVSTLPVQHDHLLLDNEALGHLDIDYAQQIGVFKQLESHYEKTRALARALFILS